MKNQAAIDYVLAAYPDCSDLYEILSEEDEVWRDKPSSRRWYTEIFKVVKIKDRFIGFLDAETTGDNNVIEMGWRFNKDSVTFVEPKEIKSFIYVAVES